MQRINITYASKRFVTGEKYTLNYKLSPNEGLLIYILCGKGKALLNGCVSRLSKGNLVICPGGDTLSFRFAKQSNCTYYFVLFETDNGKPLSKTFDLQSGIYPICDTSAAIDSFEKLIREFIFKSPFYEEKISSLFYETVYNLSLAREKQSAIKAAVYELAKEIHASFICGEINVKKYAEKVNLSKDRFSVIFKQHFGYPPYKYQLMLKMEEATRLLRHTDLSIGKISEILGFSNQLYFSSAYKKQMGKSPSEVRKLKSE